MALKQSTRKRRKFFDPRYVKNESRRSYRLAFILSWSILLYFVFEHHVVSMGIVQGRSMLPQLSEGNAFLVNKYIYHFVRPKRGDIIVLQRYAYRDDEYVKRIIGLPNETLAIENGRVYVNGRRLSEPYVLGDTLPNLDPVIIPANEYFVLGDNRMVSEDSRKFGSVSRKLIEGKIRPGRLFAFW
jgi:signal peptidase I